MWLRVWLVTTSLTCAWSQNTHAKITKDGTSFEWGWHLEPDDPGSVGHYYVKLPQSDQHLQFASDGYHTPVDHHSPIVNFALGRPFTLNPQIPELYQQSAYNGTPTHFTNEAPPDIFLFQQQFPIQEPLQLLSAQQYNPVPNYYYNDKTPHTRYNVAIEHGHKQSDEKPNSTPLKNQEVSENEPIPVLQVFKDHNCQKDTEITSKDVNTEMKPKLVADLPSYNAHNINGHFGDRYATKRPLTYRGAVNFKVESPRENARSERYYYTTEITPSTTTARSVHDEGISRLVASTQDLISNDDLLRINHAAEKHVAVQNDDIIKPRPKFNEKSNNYRVNHNVPRSTIFLRAKFGNIVNTQIEHKPQPENNYKFASPIVVQESYDGYKDQIVNNLVSTMIPYIENGYQVMDVRKNVIRNYTDSNTQQSYNDFVVGTPRPVSQKYLAPITVALRLLNANDSESNTLDDHETSDSEFVTKTVDSPVNERTTVEVQRSIPVSITHINDVEVHEYLDEGRSNNHNPLDVTRSLYEKYMESYEKSNGQNNVYEILDNYENVDKHENENNQDIKVEDSKENLESSENINTHVEINPNNDFNSNYYNYANDQGSADGKIIQPIIIEKEIPITSYVDRFIEKEVPYPQPVEVLKEVPVDRPVHIPVPYEKIVEKPVEVTKFVDKYYPVGVPQPYPVPIKIPYPVEHKVYVDRPVHIPYPVEKVVEKRVMHPMPIPTPIAVPYGIHVPVEHKILYPYKVETPIPIPVPIEKPVPVEKIVEKEVPVPYPVEKKVLYPVHYETKVPVPYPVERRIPVPVEKIVEKPVQVTHVVEKPVHIKVPVPQPVPVPVHVPKPYPVDRIVERKVPYPVHVDRIVEKQVPVQVPYPVERVVEKIVEKPFVVTKYVDKPYPVEKRVPYPVEKKNYYPIRENNAPYAFEKPLLYQSNDKAIYNYASQSQNVGQYLKTPEHKYPIKNQQNSNYIYNQTQNYSPQQAYAAQYLQYLKDKQRSILSIPKNIPIQSSQWGNQFATTFQYLNNTRNQDQLKLQSLANYMNYWKNPNQYYGPVPSEGYTSMWEKNQDLTDVRSRRTDRVPRVSNLRIEYGFKPPLIPSTEVDLDGIPIKKDNQQ